MSPLKQSNNIAARMGRWSASHWKTAVFGWLAFVVASVAIGTQLGTKNIDQQNANVGQTHRADQLLKDNGFGQTDPQTEIVLVQSKTLTVGSPAFRATVNDLVQAVAPFKSIDNNSGFVVRLGDFWLPLLRAPILLFLCLPFARYFPESREHHRVRFQRSLRRPGKNLRVYPDLFHRRNSRFFAFWQRSLS